MAPSEEEPLRICMVSDFFCPNTGGVETHIYNLSQRLIRKGHSVIVITHAYEDRKGIRYLSNGLKVYYLPFLVFYNLCIFPTVLGTLPWIREILLRERIQLVHGHSAFSVLAHEAIFHAAWIPGVRRVFTDHSLFGFADASAIVTNKLLQVCMANVDHVVCVSHTCKENTVLRGRIPPERVSVIPNAVDCRSFRPLPGSSSGRPLKTVTVVVLSRLTYRKGVDLLAALIPTVCSHFPPGAVRFVIGGDGPKRVVIEEMRDRFALQHLVTMLGTVPHTGVREVLLCGDVFVSASLTEAFCMAIVEAASCGLHVVSTRVGGVPEVLPPELITLAEPNANDLTKGVIDTIDSLLSVGNGAIDRWTRHETVRKLYRWSDVAERTETVYRRVLRETDTTRSEKLFRFFRCGFGFGLLFATTSVANLIFLWILNWIRPESSIRRDFHRRSRMSDGNETKRQKVRE